MSDTRTEHDSFGLIEVPANRLWGAQTQRSLAYFAIGTERMPPELIRALVQIKRAAAIVNAELGELEPALANAIVTAADEVLAGAHPDEFPLSVWQTGSGTQTNMNVNEVLANRASALQGGDSVVAPRVHPNDHVNRGQSSNDVFPTAMHIAAAELIERRVLPSLTALRRAFEEKARAFAQILKIGRTHLQDAVPMTLGQEFSGYAAQIAIAAEALDHARGFLHELAIGGTAVGTGLNAHAEFGSRVAAALSHDAIGYRPARNAFAALGGHEPIVFVHGALKTAATALHKIANDIRLLASGPRAGLAEIALPENEPGSSIMPGKVNPTQAEALTMVCVQVLGNDATINFAGASGHLELNVYKPLIAHAMLQSARLLADAADSFRQHCVEGIQPNRQRLEEMLGASLMLVTALTPHIGYERAGAIAHKAHSDGTTLKEAALALGHVTAAEFDAWIRPETMVGSLESLRSKP
jgi:fumarate hydratase, class II